MGQEEYPMGRLTDSAIAHRADVAKQWEAYPVQPKLVTTSRMAVTRTLTIEGADGATVSVADLRVLVENLPDDVLVRFRVDRGASGAASQFDRGSIKMIVDVES